LPNKKQINSFSKFPPSFMFSFLMIIAQQKTNQLFFEISPKFYQIITPV